jgi:F420-0:gamma-glutamyl ligase
MNFEFIPIKTRVVHPPQDKVWDILDQLEIRDGDILFITSKILAIHQGRCVPLSATLTKEQLIKQEATHYFPYTNSSGYHVNLTITDNVLIPAAGIDESNADDHYILWPLGVDVLCQEIRSYLCQKNNLQRLGVVCTDSHTTPLRIGVLGITIGLAGLQPLRDIRGQEDIFGRRLRLTQVNLIDPLSAMAVLLMGECAEQTPLVILRNFTGVQFDPTGSMEKFKISPEVDLYQPLLDVVIQNSINQPQIPVGDLV